MTFKTMDGLMVATYMGFVSLFPVNQQPDLAYVDLASPSEIQKIVSMEEGQQVSAVTASELKQQDQDRARLAEIEQIKEQGKDIIEAMAEMQTEKERLAEAAEPLPGQNVQEAREQAELESRQAQERASLDMKQSEAREVQSATLVERRDQLAGRYENAAPEVQTEQLTKFDEAAKMVNDSLQAQQAAERQALESRQAAERQAVTAVEITQRPPIDPNRTL